MVTALDIISSALRKIGSLAGGDTVSATDARDSLKVLNVMIDAWGIQRGFMQFERRTALTLVASTASYTIGIGGAINIVRPTYIDRAGIILDTSATTPAEVPIEVLTDQRRALIRIKTLTSTLVQAVYYDHAYSAGLGNIYVYPIPTSGSTQLVIYSPDAVAQFATLDTEYTLSPGYQEAFEYNLAVRLGSDFGKEIPSHVDEVARDSRYNIAVANLRPEELGVDDAIVARSGSGTFNWLNGGFGR